MARSVQNLTVNDLVSVKTLLAVAKMIRVEAAKVAKSKRAPLQSNRIVKNVYNPNLIGITAPQSSKDQSSVGLTLSEVAMAFEYGSGKHAGGDTYPIVPKNKKILAFHWDKAHPDIPRLPDGRVMLGHVDHPGVAARPFMKDAVKNTREERLKLLRQETEKNIRRSLIAMKRVVK